MRNLMLNQESVSLLSIAYRVQALEMASSAQLKTVKQTKNTGLLSNQKDTFFQSSFLKVLRVNFCKNINWRDSLDPMSPVLSY